MLPEVQLQQVSREDVDRVAWWLEDDEVSSRWFGHYGCGDPVHRGYDPLHMIEASDAEWERVFGDPRHLTFSVYSDSDHIGECQVVPEADGGAELSLLIGRKDLWNHGYGTATVMTLMERVFGDLRLDRAWVRIPEDNSPALGLFEKLGFVREATRAACRRPYGGALITSILTMDVATFLSRWRNSGQQQPGPVVTVNGMAGSGAEDLGRRVARMTGRRFVDAEIAERVCERLSCGPGELAEFETGHRSIWSRLLNALAVPMEWSVTYDAGYQWFTSETLSDEGLALSDRITKKRYTEALASAVRRFAAEGKVVLHGHGSQLFTPRHLDSFNVFVYTPLALRAQRIASDHGWSTHEAEQWLKKADSDALTIFDSLLGADMRDEGLYDLIVNLGRVPDDAAAQTVANAVSAQATGPSLADRFQAALAP